MSIKKGTLLIVVLFFLLIPALSTVAFAEPPATTKPEISYLLDHVERSGCEFYRNGTWYKDTKAARKHMERKYDYFAKRGRVNSTEDFIRLAGTKSEASGKPYMVRCGNNSPTLTSQWLTEELERYRRQKGTP